MLLRTISNINHWKQSALDKIGCSKSIATGLAVSDLKASGNTLSVWYTPSDKIDDVKDIIAAAAVTKDSLSGISYVLLEEKELERLGIDIAEVLGIVKPVTDNDVLIKHRDLINIDFWRIGYLAEYISKQINESKEYSKTKAEVKKMIAEMIDRGKVNVDLLKDGVRKHFVP